MTHTHKGEVTIQGILDFFEEAVRERHPIAPSLWIDSSQKIVTLLGDEHAKLFDLNQKVAQMKAELIAGGDKATTATIKVEASDTFKEACLQKAYVERIFEHIRLAKIQARMGQEEAKGYGI